MSTEQQPMQKTEAMKLIEHERELEKAITLYEQMFGTIVNGVYHDHCHSITYLKGRLDGLKHAMRTMDF